MFNGLVVIFLFFVPLFASSSVKGQGPFFWQIERDGKSSYVLGTMHSGVNFEELQCHEEIKEHLVSADFLLTEVSRSNEHLYELDILFDQQKSFKDNQEGLYSLSPAGQDFFRQKFEEFSDLYYEDYQKYPDSKDHEFFYNELGQSSYYNLQNFIQEMCNFLFWPFFNIIDIPSEVQWQTSIPPSDELEPLQEQTIKKNLFKKFFINEFDSALDDQVLSFFLNHKQDLLNLDENLMDQFLFPIDYAKPEQEFDLTAENLIASASAQYKIEEEFYSKITSLVDQVSSVGDSLKKLINQLASSREDLASFMDQFPKPLEDKTMLVDQFVSPLDDLVIKIIGIFFEVSIPQKEDIEEWIHNFDERCSDDQNMKVTQLEDSISEYYLRDKGKSDFIKGVIVSPGEDYRQKLGDQNAGFLETEIKQSEILTTKYVLDFRNEIWRRKIIKAHTEHNSIFIAGGADHFTLKNRNPLKLKALEEYAEANKALPTNVLDMLKEEGFTIKRMKTDCSFK